MTYNGWTNYETWAVGMYLDGNYTGEGTYQEVQQLVRKHDDEYQLASALEDWFDGELPEFDGIAGDLLRAARDEVNWFELAKSKLEEVKEEVA